MVIIMLSMIIITIAIGGLWGMGSVGIGGISGAARDALHPPTTSNQILLDLLEDILDIINIKIS